jgi:hypothetical protein
MKPVSRRNILLSSFSFFALPTMGFAESKTVQFEYIPSKLGIDYRALAPSPLAEMLSQGEVEWMENAPSKYGSKAGRLWKLSISKKVSTGAISQSVIEKLRAYTPNMLTKFAVGLNPQDTKYGYLWSVGTNHLARKLAGKS